MIWQAAIQALLLAAKLLKAEVVKSGWWKGILSLLKFESIAITEERSLLSLIF